jgi:hypothetical protein
VGACHCPTAHSVPGSGGIFRIKAFVSEGVLLSISTEEQLRGFVHFFIYFFSIYSEVNLGMDFIMMNGLFLQFRFSPGYFSNFMFFLGYFCSLP